ncbi:MAG: tRNA (adenosine(37)-N6)-threonylcarbamoyltransferase complex ATPase subunit type 1 TsaE [Candidatus Gracilibacteria bacterium]|jgi:tRNA threonylcarbamoyladenosine biosynthesis protein TsaE
MTSKNKEQTREIAHKIAKNIKDGGVICLYGDLGTGKTEFSKAVAEYFGIDDFSVKSPTYNYIRFYQGKKVKIYHIDLYRLEEIDDLLAEEIKEIFEDKSNIVLIEWAERMRNILPNKRIDVTIEHIDENSRGIKIHKRNV